MKHSCVGHEIATHQICMWDMPHICGTLLIQSWDIQLWDMTRSCVGHSYSWARLIYTWDTKHSYVGHDSLICGTWLLHIWDMIHPHVVNRIFDSVVSSAVSITSVLQCVAVCCSVLQYVCRECCIICSLHHAEFKFQGICYGVASNSRLLKITGLFCRI